MSNKSQLKAGTILSYSSIFINIVAGLLFTPWMIKQIGQSQYGLYTLANSLIVLFMVDFGLSSATSRFVSKYHAEGNQEKVNNFLGAVYKLYLTITMVIFVALIVIYFFIDTIYVNLTAVEQEQFKVVYIISVLFAVINFPCVTFNGILNAYEKFIPLKLADIMYRVGFVVFTAVALMMGMGLYALVAIHALVGLLVILFKFIVIKTQIGIKANFKYKDKTIYKEIFAFSIWATVTSLVQRAIFNFTPTILGMVVQNASVAISIFGIITTIESYAYLIPGAINGMFMPKISQIYASANTDNLTPLLNKVGKFQFFLNGLIVTGFAVIGKTFINLWVGEDYSVAYIGILFVIIPGVYYNSLQIANTTMLVINQVKKRAGIDCIMAVTNIILSFVFSYYYGVIGACAGILAAYTVRVVMLTVLYNRILPLDIVSFVKNCFVRMTVPMVFSIIIGMLVNIFVKDGGWFVLAAKGLGIAIVYSCLQFMFGFNKDERKDVLRIAESFIRR